MKKRTRATLKAKKRLFISPKPDRDQIQPPLFVEEGPSVTAEDVRLWMLAVPRIDPDGPRAAAYVRAYHVADKIRAAKLAGTFWQIVTRRPL